MANEWAQNKVDDWLARGLLSKDSVMERLDREIWESYAIEEEEVSTLRSVFRSVCTEGEMLTEASFISFLQTKSALPRSPEGTAAGKMVYASLVYLSTLPFPPPSSTPHPDGITLAQLTRALAWALPGRDSRFIEECPDSRMRTRADHRRRIFQSLASTTANHVYDPSSARQLALRNAFDVEREDCHEICKPNHDDDGDEIYHDLVDVLCATQKTEHPGLSTAPRDPFRGVARSLAAEYSLPHLYSLGIPAEQFVTLVKLLLAFQFHPPANTDGDDADLSQFDTAARALTAAFHPSSEPSQHDNPVITYPLFDHALKHTIPYLLDPLYHLLSTAFFNRPGPGLAGWLDPPASTSSAVLTLPRLSQLSTHLAGSVDFTAFRRVHHYSPTTTEKNHPSTTAASFISALEAVPEEAVVLITGTDREKTGEMVVFGLFSPWPKADGASVQATARSENAAQEGCALVQLAPVQDVFRGVVGQLGWREVEGGVVVFGREGAQRGGGGVVVTLGDGLRMMKVSHRQVQGGENQGDSGDVGCSFVPNVWRGDWEVIVDVEEIEIWSELEVEG
ncbi:hypothetical protein C8A01DRAFT_31767 [Parachaetomium inaequale]|uniref:TLDc domain-containing protein n=1 Tax=Parachaetomium inaequale TaxID=2588326 RepID=A0AAN6SVV8_9PEZI|nr:hypothetical protein C8A01DRAFT_31767 [Parachaetomium inaequale]